MKKKRNLTLIIGAVLTAFMLLFLLIGFFYTPYDPDAMNGAAKFAAPSLSHPFGCDHFGRDIFSRVLKGTGTTFFRRFRYSAARRNHWCSCRCVHRGIFGGWIDEILMRINDVIVSFPGILLALVFIALLGPRQIQRDPCTRYRIHSELCTYHQKRISRTQKIWTMSKSARLMGVSHLRIIFVHILPNTVPSLLSMAANRFQQRRSLRGRHELSRHRCPAARCLAWTDALRIPDVSDDCSLGLCFPRSCRHFTGAWRIAPRRRITEERR